MRRAWSGMTASVSYTCIPYLSARRRAMVDLPDPLPPPIQYTWRSNCRSMGPAAGSLSAERILGSPCEGLATGGAAAAAASGRIEVRVVAGYRAPRVVADARFVGRRQL